MREEKCHSGAVLKNNMKGKNKDKDRWLTSVRVPFEGVVSKWVLLQNAQMQGFD